MLPLPSLFGSRDPAPLSLFRFTFGLLMLADVFVERGLEDVDIRFGDPNHCFFPLFQGIRAVPLPYAIVLYSFIIMGSLGISVGLKFKFSCLLYLLPYLYFFLLDKSRWNNHSYLYALLVLLLFLSDAGKHNSLDAFLLRNKEIKRAVVGVPAWNYGILKFQIFILYFFAGIKKLNLDWVEGYSMRNLGGHWIFGILKEHLTTDIIDFYFIHMGGLLYDLSVGFMLFFKRTRSLAVILSLAFHGLNSQLFNIGMFPYVCLASLILFYDVETQPKQLELDSGGNCWKRTVKIFLTCYVLIQLFLPFSHFITKGYNNWTPGLYGYSWDMMINSWSTLHQKITIRNMLTNETNYLEPSVWVGNDRWSSHADMAVQYAQCISRNLQNPEIQVHFDILKSLNGRFQQRIFNPNVDILHAEWDPFKAVQWLLPLLSNYSDYRKFFESLPQTLENYDYVFVADFPGLCLENYLPSSLTNVSVTVINGGIRIEQDLNVFSLNEGDSLVVKDKHSICTETHGPSCYFYGYKKILNETLEVLPQEPSAVLYEKFETLSRSFYLIVNAYLNILLDVPMVLRKIK